MLGRRASVHWALQTNNLSASVRRHVSAFGRPPRPAEEQIRERGAVGVGEVRPCQTAGLSTLVKSGKRCCVLHGLDRAKAETAQCRGFERRYPDGGGETRHAQACNQTTTTLRGSGEHREVVERAICDGALCVGQPLPTQRL